MAADKADGTQTGRWCRPFCSNTLSAAQPGEMSISLYSEQSKLPELRQVCQGLCADSDSIQTIVSMFQVCTCVWTWYACSCVLCVCVCV